MRGGTHALAGVLIALTMTHNSQPIDGLAVVMCGAIGALLPDLDHPKSAISRRVKILGAPIRLFVAHRGALHGLLAVFLAFMACLTIPVNLRLYGLAAAAGYASHVALDALTISGVPLLWPYRRRFHLLPLRTGGVVERLLFVGGIIETLAILGKRL